MVLQEKIVDFILWPFGMEPEGMYTESGKIIIVPCDASQNNLQ